MKHNLINETKFLTVNYLLAPALGLLVCLLEAFGRIKFVHFERFPIWGKKLILVSNHPSLLEPVILPLMGFPWMNFPWVFSPLWTRIRFSLSWLKELQKEFRLPKKLLPANTPDKNNFYDPFYMKALEGINIPVDRNGKTEGRISSVLALRRILENGGRVLIFPEGGRTFKSIRKSWVKSTNGKSMGKLKDGAAWLALKTNAKVLPIWVEGTDKVLPNKGIPLPRLWHKITIKVGSPFLLPSNTRQEGTIEITRSLLALADEKE
ncbi:lysophospholipid acyltransferase family protein [Chloroflexota bacterium]